MDLYNFADYQIPGTSIFSHRNYVLHLTLQLNRSFRNTRWANEVRSEFCKAGFFKFIYLFCIFGGSERNLLDHLKTHNVYYYLWHFQHIFVTMFCGVVPASSCGGKDQDRRACTENIKKTKRREIHVSVVI